MLVNTASCKIFISITVFRNKTMLTFDKMLSRGSCECKQMYV